MPYLLDANVFIQAKNLHYGFDFCPAFWDWLIENNAQGKVFSIEKVLDELIAGDDDLTAWAQARGKPFFLPPDSAIPSTLKKISTWLQTESYNLSAVRTFTAGADYYLTAHALAHDFTIITHEKREDTPKKVKIPNVCIGLGIKYLPLHEMLRREGARFVLGGRARRTLEALSYGE